MEKLFESPSEHALDLALDTLNKLNKEESQTSAILRSCYTIASLMGDHKNKEWIDRELSGYKKDNDFPNYRKFKNKSQGAFSVDYSVHKIEYAVKMKESLESWDSGFKNHFTLSPSWSHTIISEIKDKALKFLIDTITKLRYSGKMVSLIENIQKEVNSKLTKINPQIDSEIQSISVNIIGEDSEKLSKVAHSCRRILKLLADKVFPSSDEPFIDSDNKSHSIKDDAYMNRLLMFLEKNKGDKLITKEINYLGPIFDEIRESAGKGVHATISKFETEKIFIHTYLIVSEILKHYKLD